MKLESWTGIWEGGEVEEFQMEGGADAKAHNPGVGWGAGKDNCGARRGQVCGSQCEQNRADVHFRRGNQVTL